MNDFILFTFAKEVVLVIVNIKLSNTTNISIGQNSVAFNSLFQFDTIN